MLMKEARELIVEYGKKMSSSGLSIGTSGNISIYDHELGLMAISPSGLGYFDTEPEDIVVMDLDGKVVDGARKPSSEHGLHTIVYRNRTTAKAVVHTHSTFATTLACLHEPLKPIHYMIMGAGVDELPLVPYVTFGTQELADAVGEALQKDEKTRAVLLANHGDVCFHESLPKAFNLAANLEFVAQLQWRCMCAGEPQYLSKDQMSAALERSKTYGQQTR